MDGIVNLRKIQWEHDEWARRNFGEQHRLENSVLGMGEEFGELCHAIVKLNQGIRGVGEDTVMDLIADAHCDLIIFSLGVASMVNYDLATELDQTWAKVKSRDWVEDPERGGQ